MVWPLLYLTHQYVNLSTQGLKRHGEKPWALKETLYLCLSAVQTCIYKFSMTWHGLTAVLFFSPSQEEIVRCMKMGIVTIATRPDDLSSILRTRMEEGKNKLLFESLSDLTHSYPTAQTNKFNFKTF